MAILEITPGATPNWTATVDPGQVGDSGDTGYSKKVIARWHSEPFVTYDEAGYVIGVLAFHACGVDHGDEGVAKVQFIANDGTPVDVTAPEPHPTLGYYGWWVRVMPAAADGIVEIRAVVYPHSGLCRVLQGGYMTATGNNVNLPTNEQTMLLWSNVNGTRDGTTVYVATDGNDTTGDGSEGNPFATIKQAIRYSLPANYRTIYLKAGSYQMHRNTTSGVENSSGWCLICPAPGVTRSQVHVNEGNGTEPTRLTLLRMRDVTIDRSSGTGNAPFAGISSTRRVHLWYEGCEIIGAGLASSPGTLLETSSGNISRRYVTKSANNRAIWRDWNTGLVSSNLIYGLDVSGCTNDIFTGSKFIRDFTVETQTYVSGAHPDLWQSNGSGSNRILCDGLVLADAQLLFFDSTVVADNTDIAHVNVIMYFAEYATGGLISQGGTFHHTLLWHNQLYNQGYRMFSHANAGVGIEDCTVYELRGNIWQSLSITDSGAQGVTQASVAAQPEFMASENHYHGTSWNPGTNPTTGVPDYPDPDGGDFLATNVGTCPRTVRWDWQQNARAATTQRGAYRAPSEGGPDVTAPTVTSVVINVAGDTLTIGFDEAVNGHTGFALSAGSLTYVSGDGTSSKVFSISPVVEFDESPTLDYTPGNVVDLATNALALINDRAITNNSTVGSGDTTPPEVISTTVAANGTTVTIVLDEAVDGHTGFALSGSTLTYVSGDGSDTLVFTANTTIYVGAVVTMSYTPGDVEDTAGNPLAAVVAAAVTNNSTQASPDVTAPELQSANLSDTGDDLTLTFNEVVTGSAGFTLNASGGATTLAYVSGAGTSTLIYSTSRVVSSGETLTLDYLPGDVADTSANPLGAFTSQAVTNNSTVPPPDVTAPLFVSAAVNVAGSQLTVVLNEAVTGSTGFTISATSGAATLSYVSGSGTNTLVFNLSRTIFDTEIVTLSYAPGNVADAASNALAAFSAAAVTNNSTAVLTPLGILEPGQGYIRVTTTIEGSYRRMN